MRIAILSPDLYTYGAMVIGGVLREAGHLVRISRTLEASPDELTLLSLYSTLHLMDPRVLRCVREVREQGGVVCAGGPVSAAPSMVLRELCVDALVLGEGEETVLRLAEEGVDPSLPGIAFAEGGSVRVNPPGRLPAVEHPLPLIPDDISEQSIRGASVYIETHRGCLGSCTFCQVPRFFGRAIRSREIPAILSEVRAFREKGARRISISGGTGSLYQSREGKMNPDAFVQLLQGLAGIMGPRNVSAPDIRVDCITDDILEAVARYTIGWIFFGLESGSDRVLRSMGKGATVAQALEAIDACREHGLRVAGSFIVGYPTEGEEDFEATKDLIAESTLDDTFISIAEPIPGTPLADLARRTPDGENPVFFPHTGEYRSLHLTEGEARHLDLLLHSDLHRPVPRFVDDARYTAYLAETRKQGDEIRRITRLVQRYPDA